ncbi:hypothetical protein FJ945_26080 [Mesorhizobium sp. B2-4-9]|uniref:hypothetical protein n=1 Tax=Mesorhizobium sp. B2-4-9 TaxID=2589940 RepID=UPI00112C4B01|nr:hypothetical protein [Mesorhizobium sp. B2-4-9]TPL16958.1 hypothetical protein FJ945_26080 [Mesorhizobium sp. B2-4-9]
MALHDERRRIEALFDAVRRRAGAFGQLDDEQREWLAAWREDQPPFDYETMINATDRDSGEGLRSDIRRVLYGEVPTILVTDTEAMAGEKLQRYLGR